MLYQFKTREGNDVDVDERTFMCVRRKVKVFFFFWQIILINVVLMRNNVITKDLTRNGNEKIR